MGNLRYLCKISDLKNIQIFIELHYDKSLYVENFVSQKHCKKYNLLSIIASPTLNMLRTFTWAYSWAKSFDKVLNISCSFLNTVLKSKKADWLYGYSNDFKCINYFPLWSPGWLETTACCHWSASEGDYLSSLGKYIWSTVSIECVLLSIIIGWGPSVLWNPILFSNLLNFIDGLIGTTMRTDF